MPDEPCVKQRRGPKPKGTVAQNDYLHSRIPDYLACQGTKKWHKFWSPFFQDWLARWPISDDDIESAKATLFAEAQAMETDSGTAYASVEEVPRADAEALAMKKEKFVSVCILFLC
jgi:hypothetical protein